MNDDPLQPLNWREQLRVNSARLFGDLRSAFSNASPLLVRAFLAGATLSSALGLWCAGEEWTRLYVFEAMRVTVPQRWVWALAFTAGGIAQWWRLIDDEPRLRIGRVINVYVALLWTLVTVEVLISGSWFVATPLITVTLQAYWLALRTGVTDLDRRRA